MTFIPNAEVKNQISLLSQLIKTTRGFMPESEGLALAHGLWLTQELPPYPAVEIGSYLGLSTIYLGKVAEILGLKLITIDHHRGSEEIQPGWEHHDPSLVDPVSGQMDTLYGLRRTITLAGLESSVIIVASDSQTFASVFETTIGFLFIDGGHGKEQAHLDFDNWEPKLADGGILAIHDVFENPELGGTPPYEIYLRSKEMGFRQLYEAGSLRVMQKER